MKAVHYEFDKLLNPKKNNYVFQYIHNRKLSDIYHSHDFYEIVLVICGWCITVINEKKFSIGANDLFILRPNDRHLFCGQSDDLQIMCISVQKDEFEMLANAYNKTLIDIILQSSDPKMFKNCREKTIKSFVQVLYNTTNKEEDYKLLLFYLLKIYIDALDGAKKDIPSDLEFALNEIKKRENLKLGVNEFVKLSNYSQSHLARLMKKYFNTTIHNYILNLKLEAAYNDLVLTKKSSEDISE
ncbi:MAG: AraC family ligand binding domain-containing protein, partial [Clostridia bacterium]|nr:AraC family ligand binding domain-containing protein [Clostridia bacterium]